MKKKKGNYITHEPGRGYRRVVAAPKPKDIVEIDAIRTLADAGQIVIACGGGGIPVMEQNHKLRGASAVIEKDYASGRLAQLLDADVLVILTATDHVYLNYGTDNEVPLEELSLEKARQYIDEEQFGAGNMLPKIEASLAFIEEKKENRTALITSLERAKDGINGKTGTRIHA